MSRFLSNYVIGYNGRVVRNAVVTLDDANVLLSVAPIDAELASVRYVAAPVLVVARCDLLRAVTLVGGITDVGELSSLLSQAALTPVIEGQTRCALVVCDGAPR